jgi:hypothetical protein
MFKGSSKQDRRTLKATLEGTTMNDQVKRGMAGDWLQRLSRPSLAVLLAMPPMLGTGCAGGLSSLTSRKDCAADCQGDCLPQDVTDVPPAASLTSAHRCVDTIPRDAVPAPVGTYVNHWRTAMSEGAQQQHWYISRNEWFDGGNQLGPEGQKHVDRIAQCLLTSPNMVVLETEPVALSLGEDYEDAVEENRQLQTDRRNAVVAALAQSGVPDAEQWVVFADDRSVGVRGVEAPQVFNSQFGGMGGNRGRLGQGQGGIGGGIGGGGIGGFGGGGIGGGLGGGFGGGGFGGGGIF